MTDSDLLFTPAAKAAALIRARKLSPVEYVDAVLKAIERANPRLNCFREVTAKQARIDARRAEEAVVLRQDGRDGEEVPCCCQGSE